MDFLPVTSVKFISDTDFILSASGNTVNFIHIPTKKVIDQLSFPSLKVIHGLSIKNEILIVYGGFSFEVCSLMNAKLTNLNLSGKHNDFILDCIIIGEKVGTIEFCVALAHGSVCFYELRLDKTSLAYTYEMIPIERSLLYCCHLFIDYSATDNTDDTIYLAGGGVQNTIFVWQIVRSHRRIDTLARLEGHKGAIFGVHVNLADRRLVSVSDDRSVFVWSTIEPDSMEQWQLERRFFGHEARVWGAINLPGDDSIVSWGEDCSVRQWSLTDGVARQCISMHTGRSIWAGDVRLSGDQLLVVTGGNDGAVIVHELSRGVEHDCLTVLELEQRDDFPRRVALVEGGLIVVTDQGRLWWCSGVGEGGPMSINTDMDLTGLLASYCAVFVTKFDGQEVVVFGNMIGSVVITSIMITEGSMKLQVLQVIEVGHKIMAISNGLNDDVILSLTNGQLMRLTPLSEVSSFSIEAMVALPNRGAWATCLAIWIDSECQKLVCGDRDGRLYWFTGDRFGTRWVIEGTHQMVGKCSITCLTWNLSILYVGNKAGEIWFFPDNNNAAAGTIILKNPDLLGWACRMEADFGILVVTGFKSIWFRRIAVRINGEQPQLLLERACGGGHRDWDHHNSSLAFIQSRAVHILTWHERCAPAAVIKPALHGKSINCCMPVLVNRHRLVLATASEDCTLALIDLERHDALIQSNDLNLVGIRRMYGHISSIRCITRVGSMIVSAGGRGQLVFWRIDDTCRSMYVLASSLLPRMMRSHTDTRAMDLCPVSPLVVALACSDGSLVLVSLPENKPYRPKLESCYRLSKSCLTNVSFIHNTFVCSSTDGNLYWMDKNSDSPQSIHVSPCALHGLDSLFINEHVMTLSIGGDDGSMSVITLSRENKTWSVSSMDRQSVAHAGSTVATRWLPGSDHQSMKLVSLGSDGHLILWTKTDKHLYMVRCISSSIGVTDPHSMTIIQDETNLTRYWFYLVGMGARLLYFDIGCE